jgi:hypothetical protein
VLAIEKNSILFTVVFFLHAQTPNKSSFVPLFLSLTLRLFLAGRAPALIQVLVSGLNLIMTERVGEKTGGQHTLTRTTIRE